MNKKIMIALIFTIISPAQLLLSNQSRDIRRDLKFKYENNLLDECHLSEEDLDFIEVLDRDMHILEEHTKGLERLVSKNKGYFRRNVIPFLKTAWTANLGTLSVAMLGVALVNPEMINQVEIESTKALLTDLQPLSPYLSGALTLWFLKNLCSRYGYYGKLDADLMRLKTKINRDKMIIAKLKALKYNFVSQNGI